VIEGFSMGGYGAGMYAAKYPDLFSVCIMYDAAMFKVNWESMSENRGQRMRNIFSDEVYYKQYSP
jgi:pimeloyl-ACP methyl ester carboxylesterase